MPGPAPPAGLDAVLAKADRERAPYHPLALRSDQLAAAALLLVAGLAVGFRASGDPPSDEITFGGTAGGVTAAAQLEDRPWGTSIDLRVTGLPAG